MQKSSPFIVPGVGPGFRMLPSSLGRHRPRHLNAQFYHCCCFADAYSVLGVAPDISSSEVKRRYMRLSLQIHPDKCLHKVTPKPAVSAGSKL